MRRQGSSMVNIWWPWKSWLADSVNSETFLFGIVPFRPVLVANFKIYLKKTLKTVFEIENDNFCCF